MAVTNPLFVKDASVKLTVTPPGTAAEFNCDVHSVTVEATPGDDVTYQTLCPNGSYTRKGTTTYVLHLTGVQDWATDGLSLFLWNHAGAQATALVQAHGATQAPDASHPTMSMSVTLVEGSYGGEADTWAEFDVSLPCSGRPTLGVTLLAADEEAATEEAAA